MSDMKRFNALTKVTAKPMTRQAYNDLRGWDLPADEDGSDDGYLTVDINADSNFDGYDGHVSWKPKALFDDQFYEADTQLAKGMPCIINYIKFDGTNDSAVMEFFDGHSGIEGDSFAMSNQIYLSDDKGMHMGKVGDYLVKYSDGSIKISETCPIDNELDDDEVATLASGGSLCDCCEFVQIGGDCPIEEGDEFDFGSAVHLLKIGKKVARKGWNGAGMYVYYVPAASYPAQRNSKSTMAGEFPDDMVPYREYLALKTAQGDVATWAPSVSDALATDWCLA